MKVFKNVENIQEIKESLKNINKSTLNIFASTIYDSILEEIKNDDYGLTKELGSSIINEFHCLDTIINNNSYSEQEIKEAIDKRNKLYLLIYKSGKLNFGAAIPKLLKTNVNFVEYEEYLLFVKMIYTCCWDDENEKVNYRDLYFALEFISSIIHDENEKEDLNSSDEMIFDLLENVMNKKKIKK